MPHSSPSINHPAKPSTPQPELGYKFAYLLTYTIAPQCGCDGLGQPGCYGHCRCTCHQLKKRDFVDMLLEEGRIEDEIEEREVEELMVRAKC